MKRVPYARNMKAYKVTNSFIIVVIAIIPLMANTDACTKDMKDKEMETYNSCAERQVSSSILLKQKDK